MNVVESNDAPTIDSVAPTTVAEGVTYTYAATATDPDGPAATWTTQHHSVPSVRVAQVWIAPASTVTQVVAAPTWVGTARATNVPSPSWP